MWGNRQRLAARGLQLPGFTEKCHSRASRDIREAVRPPNDPVDPWVGEWDVLAGQALRVRERAVISNELLASCSVLQADRGVRSLLRGEVHVVATVRDFASVLPAEWRESIKVRGTTEWKTWLDDVIVATPAADRRRQSWFWRVHDTLAILDMWSQHIPPEQVHVVTVPRQDSGDVLWARFASVLGIDPEGYDLTHARRNSSLGLAETECLRRINQALPPEMPDWFYSREIKQVLAHGVLSARPHGPRLALPPSQHAWAMEQADILIAGLRDAGYHIVGDLAELRPAAQAGPGGLDEDSGDGPSAEQQFEAAIEAAVALATRFYQVRNPGPEPRQSRSARHRVGSIRWKMLNGPRVKRRLRRASHHASVRRLRVLIWRLLTHPGRVRRLPGRSGLSLRSAAANVRPGHPRATS